jgi:hypothetical protein
LFSGSPGSPFSIPVDLEKYWPAATEEFDYKLTRKTNPLSPPRPHGNSSIFHFLFSSFREELPAPAVCYNVQPKVTTNV